MKILEEARPGAPVSPPYKEKLPGPDGVIDYKPEFKKLINHIFQNFEESTHPDSIDESKYGKKSLLLWFADISTDYYLNITTTAWHGGKYIQLIDFVLEKYEDEKTGTIIARGNCKDWNHLLDELQKYGIVQDPKKCRCK